MLKPPRAPTLHQLDLAEHLVETRYGDPFYRLATAMVRLSKRPGNHVDAADALAALLLTWNAGYYRFRPDEKRCLVADLSDLLREHRRVLARLSRASIRSLDTREDDAREVFAAFDEKLGPVGAAKALHLLAPGFFPIWDTKIAKAYMVGGTKRAGYNADRYVTFMSLVQEQCRKLPSTRTLGRNQLRALDEFNFCRYTRGWL